MKADENHCCMEVGKYYDGFAMKKMESNYCRHFI
jgi:hypothetical protein